MSKDMYELCRVLNMDKETEEISWRNYTEVSQRFTLAGPPAHWFCCALYAACRESYTPTVGGSDAVVMGNCVSLNKLLRCCEMSIYEFISKIKNWHEMAKLSPDFLEQIQRLEQTFSITYKLFQKYNQIFKVLYLCPRNEKKNTKYRSANKCSSSKLYDMCWCLYLCAKNENPRVVDLVTSFHLLICCIDLVYTNVLAEKRVDLINPDFDGVPDKWNTEEFDVRSVSTHCTIVPLCRLTRALEADVKHMKDNSWKNIIKEFFQTNTIFGNRETFLGIVSNQNFDQNCKSLNSAYDQYVLSVGEFDERILLNNPNDRKALNKDSIEGGKMDHPQDMKCFTTPGTPYTRINCLPSKDSISEPIASATNNVKKLQEIANVTEPSEFIRQSGDDVLNKIKEILLSMSKTFHADFPNKGEATNRFQLAQSLYFYLLDKIIKDEFQTKPNINLKSLLETDTFNTTLIACCVEIVLEAYNSQQNFQFPWILNCFSINAYNFLKIICIVVRSHGGILTRPLIKHLNCIEETCLESLVWKKDSPLWIILKSPLPTWSEVDVETIRNIPQLESPINSAYDTFSSKVVNDSARRDLFNNAKETRPHEKTTIDNMKKPPPTTNKRPGVGAGAGTSLKIFLRKCYKLAWLRMNELCLELDLKSDIILNKIWTLFEYSITQRTLLMQDRHLDQILMCAIYIYMKVAEVQGDELFLKIMKSYRKQPQANSNTYRSVLIEVEESNGELKTVYDDIIKFYNKIYVKNMTPYALDFSEKKKLVRDLLLSPHPIDKQCNPIKISNLVVYPMQKNEVVHSPNHVTFEFCKSPAKDLQKMNEIVSGKRKLPFDGDSSAVGRKIPRDIITALEIIKDRKEERK